MSELDIVTKQTVSKAAGRFQWKHNHPFDFLILDIIKLIYPPKGCEMSSKNIIYICVSFKYKLLESIYLWA